jgi:hypothetical protein
VEDDAARRSWCVLGMRLPLEGTLLEKLRKIKALHAGTKVDGEREAARRAAVPLGPAHWRTRCSRRSFDT